MGHEYATTQASAAYSQEGTLTVGQALLQYMTDKNYTMLQAQDVINTNGIPTADLNTLVNQDFTTTTTNNLFTSISNGDPMMAIILNADGTGHEVMITGYNTNGTMEYFDPQSGTYDETKLPSQFHNVIVITGIK